MGSSQPGFWLPLSSEEQTLAGSTCPTGSGRHWGFTYPQAGSLCHCTVCVPSAQGMPPASGLQIWGGHGLWEMGGKAELAQHVCANVCAHKHTHKTRSILRHTGTHSNMYEHSHLVCGSVTESPEPTQPPQDTRLLGMTLSAKMVPYFPPAISEAARGPWVGPGQGWWWVGWGWEESGQGGQSLCRHLGTAQHLPRMPIAVALNAERWVCPE